MSSRRDTSLGTLHDVYLTQLPLNTSKAYGRALAQFFTFLDKPGFDQECRELYRKYPDWKQVTLEDVNAIARKYGTIYKTFE